MKRTLPLLALLVCVPLAGAGGRADVLVADFEGDYPEGWKATGTAFGKGPARGALQGQMAVTGYLGKGFVTSFWGGDGSTGTLTSPAFKVERKYLNFLIGGGKHPGKACVNLVVGGKVVRTATGPNERPGGSERLDWHSWDVAELEGKDVVIEMVDDEKGGWGHVNADHFLQSDNRKQLEPMAREIPVAARYLHLPVKTGAPVKRMRFVVGKETAREFEIELADGVEPDFWAFADVSAFRGEQLTVETTLLSGSKALDAITQADDVPAAEKLYREKHRPLFHFTSRFGWLNDPNGLVCHDGEWHLFYQHNPFGVNWGNMHWGHAVSPDLVRWREEGVALYPRKYGDMAFSGSAVVDRGNTSGWGTREKPPLVLAYTSTARGECVAYSTDNGRTWTEYDRNPVVKHSGRDPKLVWYEKGKHWVMAVYDESERKQWIAFYTSPDLKAWAFASRIEGFYECPDLFELPAWGNEPHRKWVLYAADGKYLTGNFNGKEFDADSKDKKQLWYGRFYAAQSFENAPDHKYLLGHSVIPQTMTRRVQVGWANGVAFPGMPFNQQMTVPVDLVLQFERGKYRLRAFPVGSLQSLRDGKAVVDIDAPANGERVAEGRVLADGLDAFELRLDLGLSSKTQGFTLDLRGTKLVYDARKQTLTCKDVTAPLITSTGELQVLVDRGSVEVFADGGRVAMSVAAIPDEKNRKVQLIPNGEVTIKGASIYRMKSAWER